MTYGQIIKHSSCRALMKDDLKAAEHKKHHSSRGDRRAHRHASAHSRKPVRHHRR
jgi:hypothetical protein